MSTSVSPIARQYIIWKPVTGGLLAIVQKDTTSLGCWAHGIVHLIEGDRQCALLVSSRTDILDGHRQRRDRRAEARAAKRCVEGRRREWTPGAPNTALQGPKEAGAKQHLRKKPH